MTDKHELADTGAHETQAEAAVAEHDPATHMDSHATISDDDHGHAEATLGPIDWTAWAYGLVGAAAGLIVLVAFWVALN